MYLQTEEAFGVGSVVDPVSGWHTIDPSFDDVALSRNRHTIPDVFLGGRSRFLVLFQPQWIKVTAAALTIDATGPMAILTESFHLRLRSKHRFGSVLAWFGLSTEHHTAVARLFPLHVAGKDEVFEVVSFSRQIGAVGTWNDLANKEPVFHSELAGATLRSPTTQVLAIEQRSETFRQIRLGVCFEKHLLRQRSPPR